MLNLAEFMEQRDRALPIAHRTLGECALQYHAYAKALHHKEIDAFRETNASDVEALISINTSLQQHDAAWGALEMAQQEKKISEHETWFERLGKWQEALDGYREKLRLDPTNADNFHGKLRCLHALGEWNDLAQNIHERWAEADTEERREFAPMAAAAAWSLRDWDSMDDYIGVMRSDSPDRAFYRAIVYIHKNMFGRALGQISRARDLLDPELTSLVGESYGRTYSYVSDAHYHHALILCA
jgi:FKBP12-rapamycin complex-associated protein